jgi:hypothetical protein
MIATTEHLSDLALDRLMAGELDGTDQRIAMQAHLEGCTSCGNRHRQLARQAGEFARLSAARPSIARRMEEVRTGGRRASRARVWVAALVAAGAAAAAIVLMARPPGGSVILKGPGVKLDAFVLRAGGTAEELLPGARVAPGDRVRFAVSAPFDGFLGLVSADAAGNVMSYLPGGATALLRLPAGEDRPVDGSVELDATLGNERTFAFLCREPVDGGQLLERVRASLAAAGGDPKQISLAGVPADCVSATFLFEKVPRP